MTIREIISGYRVPIDHGLPSDDTDFPTKYIYHLMKLARARLIYDRLNDPRFNYNLALQTLECVELQLADTNECCEKLPSGCKWLKSKNPIPETINNMINKVYNDRGDTYNRILSESSTSFKRYSFIEESDFKYLIKNSYLFVPDLNSPQWVKIEGLFYDDEVIKATCGPVCDLLDTEFPLDSRLVTTMYSVMNEMIMKVYPYFKKDVTNDSTTDDTLNNAKGK